MAEDRCTCEEQDELVEHTCPYAEDIYDDSETLCTCCPECQYQCAMNI